MQEAFLDGPGLILLQSHPDYVRVSSWINDGE